MNVRKLLLSMMALLTISTLAHGQQPFGGCWHPKHIKDWTPEKDPNAKFNKSTVPLQPRFEDVSIKANNNQYYDGKVLACLAMNPMSNQTPSQGANNFIGYNPTYWQYMDILVWWGGSAGEGIITPPSAPAIDIAHLNGVKVLGTVFFPLSQYGGKVEWLKEMTVKENGVYPYARKLFDIANYYGFDGWLINEETGGTSLLTWTEFVQDYMNYAASKGAANQEIQWYNAYTGVSSFSDMMKIKGSSYFLNYGSPKPANISEKMSIVQKLGYSKSEAFGKLYFGLDCARNDLDGNRNYYDNLFSTAGHNGSVALFNPAEHSWKKVVNNLLKTPKASGEEAYKAMKEVFGNEARFWTNAANDPTDVSGLKVKTFPGLANAIMERTTIQSKPFVTSFSAGLGKARYLDGAKKGTQDWYHRGMQSVLPTWRWWFDASTVSKTKTLSAKYNWDDAYNFGTSVEISGKLDAGSDNLMRLYKTKLAIASGDKLELVYKTAHAGTVELKLGVAENKNDFTSLKFSNTTAKNGWTVATADLSSLSGKTVSVIALNFKSAKAISNYSVLLGQLSVMEGAYAPAALQVSNLKMQNNFKELTGDARLVWDSPAKKDVHHFNVYMERNGQKSLVGQTRNEGFYIPKFDRSSASEKSVKFYVTTVTKDMKEGAGVVLSKDYPKIQLPKVTIKASKTITKTGQKIALIARADNFPTGYKWETPKGATLVSRNKDTAFFKFDSEGLYDFQVTVSNAAGAITKKSVGLVEVSDSKELKLISVNKEIHSFSGSFHPENPEWLIDGVQVPGNVKEKWCAGGKKQHWVVIDLKEIHNLYRFRIFDCGNKEDYANNFKNFKIWTTNDIESKKWTLLVDEKNRPENTKDDYVVPTLGRYVTFMPYDPDSPITIRIWEFEVFGTESELKSSVPDKSSMNINSTLEQKASFSLGKDSKKDNFEVTVTSSNNDFLSVNNLKVDESGSISYTLKSSAEMGAAKITVIVKNGLFTKRKTYEVQVKNKNLNNILAGIIPTAVTGDTKASDTRPNNKGAEGITDGKDDTYWRTSYNPKGQKHSVTFKLDGYYEVSYFRLLFLPTQVKPVEATLPDKIKLYISNTDDGNYQLLKTIDIPADNNHVSMPVGIPALVKQLKVEFAVPMSGYAGACLCEVEAFGKKFAGIPSGQKVSVYTPLLNLAGFNSDVISESKPSASSSSVALDEQGWEFFSTGVQESGALPADRKLMSSDNIPFELAPYNGNNALNIRNKDEEGTLEFKNKEKAERLYILGTSANGAGEVQLTVNYADGTSTRSKFTFGDWWGANAYGSAVYGLSRIIRSKSGDIPADNIDSRKEFRMTTAEQETDPTKEVVSVSVKKISPKGKGIISVFGITKMLREGSNTDLCRNIPAAKLSIWPNPIMSGGVLNVASTDTEKIRLINMAGVILLEISVDNEVTPVALGSIAPGNYLLQTIGAKGTAIQKVIIR